MQRGSLFEKEIDAFRAQGLETWAVAQQAHPKIVSEVIAESPLTPAELTARDTLDIFYSVVVADGTITLDEMELFAAVLDRTSSAGAASKELLHLELARAEEREGGGLPVGYSLLCRVDELAGSSYSRPYAEAAYRYAIVVSIAEATGPAAEADRIETLRRAMAEFAEDRNLADPFVVNTDAFTGHIRPDDPTGGLQTDFSSPLNTSGEEE